MMLRYFWLVFMGFLLSFYNFNSYAWAYQNNMLPVLQTGSTPIRFTTNADSGVVSLINDSYFLMDVWFQQVIQHAYCLNTGPRRPVKFFKELTKELKHLVMEKINISQLLRMVKDHQTILPPDAFTELQERWDLLNDHISKMQSYADQAEMLQSFHRDQNHGAKRFLRKIGNPICQQQNAVHTLILKISRKLKKRIVDFNNHAHPNVSEVSN